MYSKGLVAVNIYKLLILAGLLWLPCQLFAQKIVKAGATEQVRVEGNITLQRAEDMACNLARKKAIEQQFGEVLIQGNATYIVNTQTGDKVETNSKFSMLADTYVKGEWLGDAPNYPQVNRLFTDRQELWVECEVKGDIREINTLPSNIEAVALNCPEKYCRREQFKNNEPFYLYYKAPMDGYVSIFLDDRENAYCIYPYKNMPLKAYQALEFKAQQPYVFFSAKPEHDFTSMPHVVDELYLTTASQGGELNRLFVLYSQNPFTPPNMENMAEGDGGAELPNNTPSETFQRWLHLARRFDASMKVEILDVQIVK